MLFSHKRTLKVYVSCFSSCNLYFVILIIAAAIPEFTTKEIASIAISIKRIEDSYLPFKILYYLPQNGILFP